MNYTTTITKTGQIFLPKAVRTALNLLPGERVSLSLENESVTIQKTKSLEEFLNEFQASFSEETKALIKKNAGKTARELREEWANSEEGKKYFKEKYGPGL